MKFDLNTYSEKIDRILREAGAASEVFGEVDGHKLIGYELLREGLPLVYISTGIHGDEPGGPRALLSLLESGLLDRSLSFCICPMLNPTGFELGTRENAMGRDLNRDYHHLRSLEVRSHVKWLEDKNPDLFISLHEDWESSGFYYYEINLKGDQPGCYEYLTEKIREVMVLEPEMLIDDHPVRRTGWIYHEAESDLMGHWPEAIYMAKQGCKLSFTLESPSSLMMSERVKVQTIAVNSLLDYLYAD